MEVAANLLEKVFFSLWMPTYRHEILTENVKYCRIGKFFQESHLTKLILCVK